ncbi:MAG TPA: WecB/TagA/CpsF family glycosyltransferase [Pirellulales bacterium]|jgi:N-acetylglucosaminyldiphosphoundecaprenol N-acetyl-beta-D-mannosaminyltransferase|nr:WecB/TagA/CpsF family glycosyltransferase [Pirellulales bacterium]
MDPYSTLEPWLADSLAADSLAALPLWPGGQITPPPGTVDKILADARAPAFPESGRRFKVLGVEFSDMRSAEAIALTTSLLTHDLGRPQTLYFANAYTLNLAYESDAYRAVLNRADYVFGDGTGVRWAARLQGLRLQDNLNGTDLVPELLSATSGRRFRWYLLGASPDAIARAAANVQRIFPGWELAGYHHGFFDSENESRVIDEINRAQPHLLLVAMGNPIQESWIDRHRDRLQARLCIGVGALVDRWAGDLIRAPLWVRRWGMEWIDILRHQPKKWRRYLLGNPRYLYRVVAHHQGAGPVVGSFGPGGASPRGVGQPSQPVQTAR